MAKKHNNRVEAYIFVSLFIVASVEIAVLIFPSNKMSYMSPFLVPKIDSIQNNPTFISKSTLQFLSVIPKGTIIESTAKNIYKGKIIFSNSKGGLFGSLKYQVKITLLSENQKSSIYFFKRDLETIQILDSSQNSISFDDLQVGDTISVSEELNLLDQSWPINRRFIVIKE